MTPSIKIPIVLLMILLIISSCSVENSNPNKGNTKETSQNSQIEITGITKSIEFGKDGYTAMMETKDEKTYQALISIVNLNGPENYEQLNIGQEATLAGTYYKLGDKDCIKVTEIINIEKQELVIEENAFAGISPGDKISDHTSALEKESLRTPEGTTNILKIKNIANATAFCYPHPKDASLVGNIVITSSEVKTAYGIKVGQTYEVLNGKYPNMTVHGSEVEGRTYAKNGNLSYRLDVPNFTYEVDKGKIPAATTITEIVINY